MSISRSQRTAPSQVAANKRAAGGGASGLWFDHARYDGFGSTRQLLSAAGVVTDTFAFDGFGNP
ncbi:MAG: hypothetical protein ACK50U_08180 [Acidobacteriota bacterium]